MNTLKDKNILLIISGGIAAYKLLELIRLIRKSGGHIRCILTNGGAQFVTPLSVASLSENPVYTDLWSLKDETEMGHIRLSREADLIIVAPASADIIAKIAHGMADDLATTTLLAADKPVMVCPAMNPMMWNNPATQDNIQTLKSRNMTILEPADGEMACGETGTGRMPEAEELFTAIHDFFFAHKPLSGLSALVTSGPTHEPIDPVRFIGNRSSGKQGHAIAAALVQAGASVTLISGPVAIPDPAGVTTRHVQTAEEMLNAAQNALPADIAVCAAAVGDWTPETYQDSKIKKGAQGAPNFTLKENPDILATLSKAGPKRPALVIGFAAETGNLIETATAKRAKKQCDWILANDVGAEEIFGSEQNHVHLITSNGSEEWPRESKAAIAARLINTIAEYFEHNQTLKAAE